MSWKKEQIAGPASVAPSKAEWKHTPIDPIPPTPAEGGAYVFVPEPEPKVREKKPTTPEVK